MLRLIALFLLSLGLALPAIAAPLCHEPARVAVDVSDHHAGMAHGADHGAQHAVAAGQKGKDSPSPASRHECIGCVVRFALPEIARPAALPPTAAIPARLAVLHGIASTPDLPPPRA